MAFKLVTLEPVMPCLLHIEQHVHHLGYRYKAGRVFTLRASCSGAFKLFGKIVTSLHYNSGDIFTNCIATLSIVLHISTASQNKSHKPLISTALPKVLAIGVWFGLKVVARVGRLPFTALWFRIHCYH